jgi:ATP-dependent protease ClpP protease subunit
MKYLLMVVATVCGLQMVNAKDIVINTSNVCTLDGPVDSESTKKVKLCLVEKSLKRRGRGYPIYLYLASPGGSIYQGLRFVEFAKTIPNLHTITEFSASMAAAIAQLLPGQRYVTKHGVFMFHRASGSFRGQFEDGELESRIKMWKQIVKNMEKNQAKRIGITLKEYKKRRTNEWWIYGEHNVTENVADAVVTVKCTPALIKQSYKKTYQSIFGSKTVTKSACPLVN